MRTTTARVALVTAALLASAPAARAQEPAHVRIVSVKATTLPEESDAPKLPAALGPWAELLAKIPGFATPRTAFEFLGATTSPVPAAATRDYPLPRDLRATVAAERRPDGKLDVRMELTRPGRPPKKPEERARVLLHEVTAEDGATYVVRVQDAFKEGEHLLLLITPSSRVDED